MAIFLNMLFVSAMMAQSNWSCELDSIEIPPPIVYRSGSDCTPNSPSWLNKYIKQSTYWKGEETPLKTIHCNVHIWQNPAGESGWVFDDDSANTPARLAQIENWLNDLWENNPMFNWNPGGLSTINYNPDIRFRVKFENIYHYNAATVAPLNYPINVPKQTYESFLLNNFPERAKNFAIHILPEKYFKLYNGNSYFGWATSTKVETGFLDSTGSSNFFQERLNHPYFSTWEPSDVITATDKYYARNHLGHELGHSLGIYHLYEDGSREDTSKLFINFLSDAINFSRPGYYGARPGEICQAGEICFDTKNLGSCLVQSLYGCEEANNIMSGAIANENYTPKQRGRMHMNAMLDKSYSRGNLFSFFLTRNFITGYSKEHPWIVSEDEEWDFDIKFYQDIVVRSGATLTVKCVVRMVDKAKIIVEQGARLVVDGGTITHGGGKIEGNIGFWEGIELVGNSSSQQLAGANPATRPAQLILRDALVENAVCGVRNWKPGDWSKTGGYISAKNSTFRNNRKDVEMVYYPHKEQSLFVNCDFVTENTMPVGTMEGRAHVTLYETYGTRFYGCRFMNSQAAVAVPNSAHLGTGIYSLNANFTVWPLQGNPSEFKNLEVGIHATGSHNTRNYEVTNSLFTNNAIGIWNSATDNASIRGNTFLLNPNQTEETYRMGVVVDKSKGFVIENNTFTQTTTSNDLTIGTYCIDLLHPRNEIYNNNISNLNIGNLAYGDNTGNTGANEGLKYRCNDMLSNTYDIAAIFGNGISQWQGGIIPNINDPTKPTYIPAANTFSPSPTQTEGHILNHASADFSTIINYVHHDPNSTALIVKPVNNTISKVNTFQSSQFYNKSIDCPTKPYGSGGVGEKKALLGQIYRDYRPAFDDARYTYKLLIDGGNSDSLRYRVSYAYPYETWQLRTELLARSPFLSADVLWRAALNTDVLPNPVLLEILLANPHAARMDSLLAYLQEEPRSFESYMMDAIAGNFQVRTAKDELENRIDHSGAYVHYAARELIRHYLSDSTDYNTDSAAVWLARLNPKEALQMEARMVCRDRDYGSAAQLLQTTQGIEPDREPSLSHYDTELAYLALLLGFDADSSRIEALDSLQVEALNDFALSQSRSGQEQSRNVLRFFYGKRFDLPYPNLNEERKAYANKQNNKAKTHEDNRVKVYPNPASQNIIFEWKPTEQFVPERLSLMDLQGKIMFETQLRGTMGSYICDVQKLARGAYLFRLSGSGGRLLSSGKILLK